MSREVFTPVRGTEASILSRLPEKGHVYFATDTKKIYYSDGESFLPMGGNTGVWYGNMNYVETPEEGQVDFDFNPEEIEGNEDVSDGKYNLPNVNDLIFNTPDGCFYRVIEIDKVDQAPLLHCKKLTVSGGGGGGSGGGAGAGSMTVSRIGSDTINTLKGNPCFIRYKFTAVDASGEETGSGTASLYIGGILKNTFTAKQGENEIDVSPYLDQENNTIRLIVSGNIGGVSNITQVKIWNVIATNLTLTWNYRDTTINTANNFTFSWTCSTSLSHTVYASIDDLYNVVLRRDSTLLSDSISIDRATNGLTHGSHKVRIYATTTIGDTEFVSPNVIHTVICVDAARSDTIISIGNIEYTMNQYDTLAIPIVLYDPTSIDNKVSAKLRENGIDVDEWENYENGVQYYWNYTPTTPGIKTLSILSGTTEETFSLNVNNLSLQYSYCFFLSSISAGKPY